MFWLKTCCDSPQRRAIGVDHCDCESCRSHMAVLGLQPPVNFDEISQTHKDLVQVWHPDRFEHNPRLRAKAEAQLKSVQEAFSNLKAHKTQTARNSTASAAVVTRSPWWEDGGRFELTLAKAEAIFKPAVDGKFVNRASAVSFPKVLYISRQFGIHDPAEIRVVMVRLDGSLDAGWVFTRSGIYLKTGSSRSPDVPFNRICEWEFSYHTIPNSFSDRLWAKFSGQERQLFELKASWKHGGDYTSIRGVSDAHTQAMHDAVLDLQTHFTAT